MTVLVTGGLGYLGSLLCRRLPEHPAFAGEQIRILDNLRQPRFNTLWSLPASADYDLVRGDVRDEEAVTAAMEGVDAVFHLAAITNAPETFDIPDETWAVNHEAALDVYETARAAGVETFVNVSTCSVYGTTDEEIAEGAPCDPESPYGEAKLAAERELRERHDGTMALTALRLGTVYGWSPGMRFDTVVDKFALQAACGEGLTVYEGATDQRRPYLHVADAVRAMLFAAVELGDGEAYNVVGQNARLGDVVDEIEAAFPDVEIEPITVEHLNQLSYVVSDEKIRAAGFETAHDLSHGVAELADRLRALS